ncbi:MAG: NAD(P)/FAD-dependent oxidoreductase [Deltaproteobacteria bacterium]|nr:NAD(P)/FAD-dependent oxidoreductase [Deltaproteobacteria bacterium]
MRTRFDVAVVGTGAGGLTAGLKLARDGYSVLLLEAGKQFGGMLNPFRRRDYHFDVGVHYVGEAGEGQAMRRLLDGLGLEAMRFREINPECIDRYMLDGYEARLVKGVDAFIDRLKADFPAERANLDRFRRVMDACVALSKMNFGGPTASRVGTVLREAPEVLRLLRAPLGDVINRHFSDPNLRAVFAGPGGDIGLPPSRASAIYSLLVFTHYLGGAYYPVGGSGAMRDAYVEALEQHGAELLRNRLVTSIEKLHGGDFALLTSKGERFTARAVVSNMDAVPTFEMLEGAEPNVFVRRKVKRMRPSLGSFCVFAATDMDVAKAGMSDANIWHYGTSDIDAGYATILDGRMPDNPFYFLTVPTLKDPESKRAPEGQHTVEIVSFVPTGLFKPFFDRPTKRRGAAYEALKQELTELFLERAETYLPGLRDHTLYTEAATPATVWSYVRGRDGGIYGPDHTPDQVLLGRFPTEPGVPGLSLAGASVLGCGVMTCMASGMLAARAAKKHLVHEGVQPGAKARTTATKGAAPRASASA